MQSAARWGHRESLFGRFRRIAGAALAVGLGLSLAAAMGCRPASSTDAATSMAAPGPAAEAAKRDSQKTPAGQAAPAEATLPEGVVARVNGKDITRAELVDVLLKSSGPQALDGLIRREVIRQAVAGITVTEAEIEEAMKAVYARAPMETQASMEDRRRLLAGTLAERGITMDEFRESVATEVKLDKLSARQAAVTDEELRQEFDRRHGPKLSLSEIQLAGEDEARKVHQELQDGASFEQLAKTRSVDRRRGQQGGRVPSPLAKGSRSDKYAQTAAALAEGRFSEPFQVAPTGNWYILKVDSVAPASAKFEDVKDRLAEELRSRKQITLKAQVTRELMEKATILRGRLIPVEEK